MGLYARLAGNDSAYFQWLSDEFAQNALSQGCAYFAQPRVMLHQNWRMNVTSDSCDPDDPLSGGIRSVRYFCPVTCGCTSKIKEEYHRRHQPWTPQIGVEAECFER